MRLVSRRSTLRVLLLIVWTVGSSRVARGDGETPGRKTVEFEWHVPVAEVDIVRSSLVNFQGHEAVQGDGRTIPFVVVFIGVVLLIDLAKAVLALERQITYGGVVVDARASTLQITHDKALDVGELLVVGKDGTKLFERDEITDPAMLIDAIRKTFKK